MNTFLLTFDTPTHDYDTFRGFVERFDNMRLSESTYAISTDHGADEIYDQVEPLLGKDDTVYVLTLAEPWIGFGYEATNDWLNRHLEPTGQPRSTNL